MKNKAISRLSNHYSHNRFVFSQYRRFLRYMRTRHHDHSLAFSFETNLVQKYIQVIKEQQQLMLLAFYPCINTPVIDIQDQKVINKNHFSPRKVSISKPLFFNAHDNEAAKFTFLLWLAEACTGRSDNVYLQLKVVFCYK